MIWKDALVYSLSRIEVAGKISECEEFERDGFFVVDPSQWHLSAGLIYTSLPSLLWSRMLAAALKLHL
jgi:hypothetical protein